ncbi:endonuclease domain-containing protein [Algoriphagus winogradskyi]|uniref:Very-short-patch-repair endonuclease n=1 Tax=Algoriphagus winogradskyi TaxID=237017 RepID=A0ABY1NZU4_9BACT|nr:endonuclease domain-containing protein [Algoriphagus winogradskyi]SMP22196.1 Very-short-patch-repair endonuclease [Algoriphagus winogradskyi]
MHFLPYNKSLKEFSRELRAHSTLSEVLLWQKLKASQFRGYSFNRQKPLDNYIVDFYCKKLNLVIEIDGDSHFSEKALIEDQKRQKILEDFDINFLRFIDIDVKKNMGFVLNELNYYVDEWEDKNGISRSFFQ